MEKKYLESTKDNFLKTEIKRLRVWSKKEKRFEDPDTFLIGSDAKIWRSQNGKATLIENQDSYVVQELVGKSYAEEDLYDGDIVLVSFPHYLNGQQVKVLTLGIIHTIHKTGNNMGTYIWYNSMMRKEISEVMLLRKKGSIGENEDWFERILQRRDVGEDSRIFIPFHSEPYRIEFVPTDELFPGTQEFRKKLTLVPCEEEILPEELLEITIKGE